MAVIAAAASTIMLVPASAQVDIPSFTVLTCEKDCPPVTKAVVRTPGHVNYPLIRDPETGGFIEAMVDVDFTIGTDGLAKDVVVEDLLGPKKFADAAVDGTSRFVFDPATEGGKPVEENRRLRFLFRIPGGPPGARTRVREAYVAAEGLVTKGKPSEAIAAFQAIEDRTDLNLYERCMVAFALADAQFRAKDFWSARHAIRIATINNGELLGKESVTNAIRLRIRLEALNGDFAEAFAWFEILGKKAEIAADDPDKKLVDRMHALIDGPDSLSAKGRIPDEGLPVFWQHTLLKRSFEFHEVAGSLEKFELHCARHSILSPVSDKANWTVPARWSGCYVNVYGKPGTTFSLFEYPPGFPGAAPVHPPSDDINH